MDKMMKVTRKDALNVAISALTNSAIDCPYPVDEVVEVLTKMIASLEKRSTAPKAPTKTQVANEPIKDAIVEALRTEGRPMLCSEVAEVCGLPSQQRCSALLTQLVNSGAVVRTTEKRKSYFSLA